MSSSPKIVIKATKAVDDVLAQEPVLEVTSSEATSPDQQDLPNDAAQILAGKRWEFAMVTPNSLIIAEEAQRAERPHWTAELTRTFNWGLTGTLTTHRRPGGDEVVLEGQHRTLAARNSGHGDEERMRVIRYFDLTDEEEATLFRSLNDTLRVGPVDDFRQALRAKDPVAKGVFDIFDAQGIPIGKGGDPKAFMAIRTALNLYQEAPDELAQAVAVMVRAWRLPGVAVPTNWLHGIILHGLTNVIRANQKNFNPTHAVKRLQEGVASPNALLAQIRGRAATEKGPIHHSAQAFITELYNGGLRGGPRSLPPVAPWAQSRRARDEASGKWTKRVTHD